MAIIEKFWCVPACKCKVMLASVLRSTKEGTIIASSYSVLGHAAYLVWLLLHANVLSKNLWIWAVPESRNGWGCAWVWRSWSLEKEGGRGILSDGSHYIVIYMGRFCLASAFGGECKL